MSQKRIIQLVIGAVVLIFASILGAGSCQTVEEGNRGVKLRFGAASDTPLEPGIYFMFPLADEVRQVNVQEKVFEEKTSASSSDEQRVTTTIAVNYKLKPAAAVDVFTSLGVSHETWEATVFAPQVKETLKAVTARYKAKELITQRDKVTAEIEEGLRSKIEGETFTIVQVSVTNFLFSKVYMDAIEAKQVAEQAAQRAKNELAQNKTEVQKLEQQASAEAKATVTRAKAEAEAMNIRAEAEANYHQRVGKATTKGSLRHLEIEKWNGQTPKFIGGGSTSVILPGSVD